MNCFTNSHIENCFFCLEQFVLSRTGDRLFIEANSSIVNLYFIFVDKTNLSVEKKEP